MSDAERVQGNILAALRAGLSTASTKAELLDAERLASARADWQPCNRSNHRRSCRGPVKHGGKWCQS